MSSENRIRILTLNCWGLQYVSKHRQERLRGIADELGSGDHDIIGLQEVWVNSDYELIRTKLSKRLPFAKYFHSGALGSGLALFSRWPIVAASVHPYSLNGSPLDVTGGDWFVGKAAASIVIAHPVIGEIEVFNTHLYARGGDSGPESQRAHRLAGAWEYSKLIRNSLALGRYVIATGDFNSIPTSLPMRIIMDHTGMTDAWASTHTYAPSVQSSPSRAIQEHGVTADSPICTFSAGKNLDDVARQWHGKRLDFILFRTARTPYHLSGVSPYASRPSLRAVDSKVVMTGKVPGYDFSFSDHFALEATLEIRESVPSSPERRQPTDATEQLNGESESGITDTDLNSALQSLVSAYRKSRKTARVHILVFIACLQVLILMIIGSAWVPSYLNPPFVLVAGVVVWLGTTMLYTGFVFGHWEVGALTTIIEDMELYRSSNMSSAAHRRDISES